MLRLFTLRCLLMLLLLAGLASCERKSSCPHYMTPTEYQAFMEKHQAKMAKQKKTSRRTDNAKGRRR